MSRNILPKGKKFVSLPSLITGRPPRVMVHNKLFLTCLCALLAVTSALIFSRRLMLRMVTSHVTVINI